MNKFILVAISALIPAVVYGQSIERHVTGSAGNYQSASWGSLSSTTGEAMTQTFTAGNVLTQGFQQPTPPKTAVQFVADDATVDVFPNPASDKINVVIGHGTVREKYTAELYDMAGQKIATETTQVAANAQKQSCIFDLRRLPAAPYVIYIYNAAGNCTRSVKFTKVN